jgi:hypothetical protein
MLRGCEELPEIENGKLKIENEKIGKSIET